MRLGGSTIAAACGIDPWTSRVELWLRLHGKLPAPEGEQLWFGTHIEPVIFAALTERGIAAKRTPGVELTDQQRPWIVGHPDGLAERNVLVEAKLTGRYGYERGGELPLPWQAQVQTYMTLGGMSEALVAVLTAGIRLDTHTVYHDAKASALLLELAEEFMGYVERNECPPPDGSKSAAAALAQAFPQPEPGHVYRLTGEEWEWAQELRQRRAQLAAITEQVRELESRIKAADPEAERYVGPNDEQVATWHTVKSERVDVKRLRAEAPAIAATYLNETTTRRFTLHG